MLATKKPCGNLERFFAAVSLLSVLLAGCGPGGPRALLQGERLIREERYPQAVEKLKIATERLPKSAQAWNHLGLAYHGAGQSSNAVAAYRKAISLDRDLMAAHYNLGCLFLEQNDVTTAVEELTSFVSHPRYAKNADGWTKLGDALLRARRFDDAERTFNHVLRKLEVRSPEVLNGLGVIQTQRRRPAEAIAHFNSALALQRDYGPAVLNQAVVYYQQNNRSQALQKYREYLAVKPQPSNWEAVEMVANQLDLELNPLPARPTQTSLSAQAAPKTNVPPAVTNVHPRTASNVVAVAVARTNVPILTNAPKPGSTASLANTSPTSSKLPVAELVSPPAVASNRPGEIEIARVPDELVIKPAQDFVTTPRATTPPTVVPETNAPVPASPSTTKPPKRGFFDRINPFSGRSKVSGTAADRVAPTLITQTGKVVVAARATDTATVAPAPPPTPPPPPPIPRYAYLSPARPIAGNRTEAERYVIRGVKAQQAGQLTQAIADYQRATELDPAYFDAHYDLGLAAYAAGKWKQALSANEYALAIRPDSVDARHNFALALKQADYLLDAVNELEKILKAHPEETRAHLSLGNLYAQQLNQPALAREHYEKVLANDPRHPQAPQIRYWLAAHP